MIKILAQNLVDHGKDVQVSEMQGDQTLLLRLKVNELDTRMIIGRQGRTVNSLRAILNAVGVKLGIRAILGDH